jgi:hypothetical protein
MDWFNRRRFGTRYCSTAPGQLSIDPGAGIMVLPKSGPHGVTRSGARSSCRATRSSRALRLPPTWAPRGESDTLGWATLTSLERERPDPMRPPHTAVLAAVAVPERLRSICQGEVAAKRYRLNSEAWPPADGPRSFGGRPSVGKSPYTVSEMEPKVGIEPTTYALPRRCSRPRRFRKRNSPNWVLGRRISGSCSGLEVGL